MAYRDPVFNTRVKPAGKVNAVLSDEDIDAAAELYANDAAQGAETRINRVAALQTTRSGSGAVTKVTTPVKLAYNPDTGDVYAYGKLMKKDGRTLEMLSASPDLPDMPLPAGTIKLEQRELAISLGKHPRETDVGGKFAEGVLNSVGSGIAGVGSAVTGRNVANPLKKYADKIYEGNTLAEQLTWDDEAFDSWRGFVNAAGGGAGSVGAAIGAGVVGTAVGGPVAGLIAGGAVNAASAGGSQMDQAYQTLMGAMGELSEQELSESSPAYRDLRNAKMPHAKAMEQVAYEASMAAGSVAALITLPETLLGGKLVANMMRKVPGVRKIFGDVQDGATAAVNRGALGRLVDKTPGLVKTPARMVGVGAFEGTQEVVEAGLSQATAASVAGIGSTDPRDYMTSADFGAGAATGALFGFLGGNPNRNRTVSAEDPGALGGSDLAAAITGEGAPPPTADPTDTGMPLAPAMPTQRMVDERGFDEQIENVAQQIEQLFGDADLDTIMSRPEGRALVGELTGLQREKEAAMTQDQNAVMGRVERRFPEEQPGVGGQFDMPGMEPDLGNAALPQRAIGRPQQDLALPPGEDPAQMVLGQPPPDDGTRGQTSIGERRTMEGMLQADAQAASEQNPLALPGGGVQALEAQIKQLETQINERTQADSGFPDTELGKRFIGALQALDQAWQEAKLEQGPQGVMPYARNTPEQLNTPMPPDAPADGLGVAPAPLVNPEPMAAGEAQARAQAQTERGTPAPLPSKDPRRRKAVAPPAPMVPDAAVAETTPEPAEDIAAQIAEMANPKSSRDTVFVAEGNESAIPDVLPEGVRLLARPGIGTLLSTNAGKLTRFRKKNLGDADIAQLLSYPETKQEIAATGQPPVAVVAKNPDGSVPVSMVSSPKGVGRAKLEARRQAPKAEVAVVPVEVALKDRAARTAEKKSPEKAAPPAKPAPKPVAPPVAPPARKVIDAKQFDGVKLQFDVEVDGKKKPVTGDAGALIARAQKRLANFDLLARCVAT